MIHTTHARLFHLSFGVDGRALVHQQLDARQVAFISSEVQRGTTVLRATHTVRDEELSEQNHLLLVHTPCFTSSLASTVAPFSTSSWTHGKRPP